MNTDTTGDDRVDPADPMDASVDVQDTSTSDPGMGRQEPRPDQSASRDRAQSGWDVLALCAQMRDALSHVRCSLQSHPGEALHQIGR